MSRNPKRGKSGQKILPTSKSDKSGQHKSARTSKSENHDQGNRWKIDPINVAILSIVVPILISSFFNFYGSRTWILHFFVSAVLVLVFVPARLWIINTGRSQRPYLLLAVVMIIIVVAGEKWVKYVSNRQAKEATKQLATQEEIRKDSEQARDNTEQLLKNQQSTLKQKLQKLNGEFSLGLLPFFVTPFREIIPFHASHDGSLRADWKQCSVFISSDVITVRLPDLTLGIGRIKITNNLARLPNRIGAEFRQDLDSRRNSPQIFKFGKGFDGSSVLLGNPDADMSLIVRIVGEENNIQTIVIGLRPIIPTATK